jgi:hypothetical protein
MRRMLLCAALALFCLAATASFVQAATPTLGAVSATNIQGVSALLIGSVNPQGEATTYRFEYGSQGPCAANPCALTATAPAGSDSASHVLRAAISGLIPDSAYDFRLVASNGSGTASAQGTFTTTHGFGFLSGTNGFSAQAIKDGGEAANLAGSHPYQLDLDLHLNRGGPTEAQPATQAPDANLRDLRLELPPGLLANPRALDRCSFAAFHTQRKSPFETSQSGESCPDRSQVGTLEITSSQDGGTTRRFGLFNLNPPPGVAAQIGASPFGSPVVFDVEIQTNDQGAYTLSLNATDLPQSLNATDLDLSFWGIPWNASHNAERGNCLNQARPDFPWCKASVGDPTKAASAPLAFLTLPTNCLGALSFNASASAWQQPTAASASAINRDAGGQPVNQGGCQSFSFSPVTSGFLTDTKASSPSGFNFRLSNDNPQLTLPGTQLPSQTRTATVTLPPEVTINPSLGAGLEGCRPGQYAAESAFSPQGAACPNGSKIGEFSLRSPLFEELIDGAIYLAQPDDENTTTPGAENPFDTLFGIYLIAKSPERGILVKVAGKLVPNLATGQLTATFADLPQLPYTDLNVDFRTGQRAPLITPPACGVATTSIDLVPWSGPGAKHSANVSQISSGIGGGPCPNGTLAPFNPEVVTGGVNSNVNSYTPYYVRLSRKDTEQELTGYSLILPEGITGKLAGIPACPDQTIAAEHPSCPAASQVGRTLTGYGIGAALTYASGKIYFAGPYNGAPLSLVAFNSAKVGPFDLGIFVTRLAFQVDPHTAQLRLDGAASDPIPHIVSGVALHLRDIRAYLDRPQFTHNPSSCEPSQLISTVRGSGASFTTLADDTAVTLTKHFQLLNCLTLGFKPKLGIRLRGGTRRGAYPSLRATFAARGPQDSNLKRIEVEMPRSEFFAQNHVRTICTRRLFDAGNCPAGSVYGHAVAYTPLFDDPLRGDVYLRSSSGKLPDLVADLRSGAIRIIIEGKIGPSGSGGIRAFFDNLPDEPLDRFTMTLNGGRRGLLQNSANICKVPPLAAVKALGQNNRGAIFTSVLRGQCKGKKGKGKQGSAKQKGKARR